MTARETRDTSPSSSTPSSLSSAAIAQPRFQQSRLWIESGNLKADVVTCHVTALAALRTRTCPQCGLNPAPTQPVQRTFEYVPGWVYASLFVSWIVCFVLYGVLRRRVTVQLPLCADCAAADRRGRRLRSVALVGTLAAAMALLPAFLSSTQAGLVAGSCFVAGLVATAVTHRRTRREVIGCRFIDLARTRIELAVAPSFAHVLRAEAPGALDQATGTSWRERHHPDGSPLYEVRAPVDDAGSDGVIDGGRHTKPSV